ncbi:hypothetical protein KQX54_010750 [Cotesia glomerata]|uniref:DUF7041 domain-containing protein n=1 Tax=Cotesia glomerata TaxID=32391 RepID=A0AAV7HZ04_COTGL|nr:hypothetical protein KQX54_010750 [Cotesia glomerata]
MPNLTPEIDQVNQTQNEQDSKPGLTDDAKFNAVVTRLDHEYMLAVEHVIEQPPPTNKYQALKDALTNKTLWMDRLPQDLQIVLAVTEPMEMKSLT